MSVRGLPLKRSRKRPRTCPQTASADMSTDTRPCPEQKSLKPMDMRVGRQSWRNRNEMLRIALCEWLSVTDSSCTACAVILTTSTDVHERTSMDASSLMSNKFCTSARFVSVPENRRFVHRRFSLFASERKPPAAEKLPRSVSDRTPHSAKAPLQPKAVM